MRLKACGAERRCCTLWATARRRCGWCTRRICRVGCRAPIKLLSVLPHSEQDYAELDIPALEDYLLHPPAAAAA